MFSFLLRYKEHIDSLIREDLESLSQKDSIHEALQYVLLGGGKRFRPAIVMLIAESIGKAQTSTPAALCIEYFHTASLIADDLPFMDDAKERRCKPTLHRKSGEAVALLTSYGLISLAYRKIYEAVELLSKNCFVPYAQASHLGMLALENISLNTGLQGAVGGQLLDIQLAKGKQSLSREELQEVFEKKTVSLFELSFVLGWLFGGGDINKVDLIKKASHHFGFAFQLADDLEDSKDDELAGRLVNCVSLLGLEKSRKLFFQEIKAFEVLLKELNLFSDGFKDLINSLMQSVESYAYVDKSF